MFEDIDDEELDLIKEDEDESSSEGDDGDGKKRFTMSKVVFILSTWLLKTPSIKSFVSYTIPALFIVLCFNNLFP